MTDNDTSDPFGSEPGSHIWVNGARGKTVLSDGIIIKPGPQVKKIVQRLHLQRSDGRVERSVRFRSFDMTKHGSTGECGDSEGVEKASWHVRITRLTTSLAS